MSKLSFSTSGVLHSGRRWKTAIALLTFSSLAGAQTLPSLPLLSGNASANAGGSSAGASASSSTLPGLPALPGLSDLLRKIPQANLGDLGTRPTRTWATPTEAPGKRCFKGNIPINIPLLSPPTNNALLDLSVLAAASPKVPSYVYGELCMQQADLLAATDPDPARRKPPTILLLTHGITYGTWYWDFPYKPEVYSIVNHLNKAGYATLAIDRLGHGRSAHPPSALTLMGNQANITNQLISKLKSGKIFDVKFNNVGTVGHSYGSGISHLNAATYNASDAVFLTGWGHRLTADSLVQLVAPGLGSHPAALDSRVSSEPWTLDPGYLMPLPGSRGQSALHYAPNTEKEVLDLDEKLANSVTLPELGTFAPPQYTGASKAIKVPTFILTGQFDYLFCGHNAVNCTTTAKTTDSPEVVEKASVAFRTVESPFFSPRACARMAVIPNAGHDLSLEKNAGQFAAQIAYFADQAIGKHGENAVAYRAGCASRPATLFDALPDTSRLIPPLELSLQPR